MSAPRMSQKQYDEYMARRKQADASCASRMSQKDYRRYLCDKHGVAVKVDGKWSGSERRYFYGILKGNGAYEGETIRITPDEMEKHCYTPDFVTEQACGKIYHEVKGNYRLQSQDAARLRWCFAAAAHPACIFVWAKETKTHHVWDVEIWFDGGRTRLKKRNVISYTINANGGVQWQTRSNRG